MSWLAAPSYLNAPELAAGFAPDFSKRMIGGSDDYADPDQGLIRFSHRGRVMIAAAGDIRSRVSIGGRTLTLQASQVHGAPWLSDGEWHIYRNIDISGWIYCSLPPGTPPGEEDSWYSGSSYVGGFTAQGLQTGGGLTATVVPLDYPRWEADDQDTGLGYYSPLSGASGKKIFGNPSWNIPWVATFIRGSRRTEANDGRWVYNGEDDYYTPVAMRWMKHGGVWRLVWGTHGSASGWWEAATDPVPESNLALAFTVPEGSEVTGTDLTLTWAGWKNGDLIGSGQAARERASSGTLYVCSFAVML